MANIVHQKQVVNDGCMSACMAMLTQLPVEQVMYKFHDEYNGHKTTPQKFLTKYGITYIYEDRNAETVKGHLQHGFIYLLSVPSLAIVNVTHALIVDLRGANPLVYDPNNEFRVFGTEELDVRTWSIELIITSRPCDVL